MALINSWFENTLFLKFLYSLIAFLVTTISFKIIMHNIHKKSENIQKFYTIKKYLNYLISLILIIILINIWFDSIESMSTYLGLLSAGLAIALKDFIVNMVSWFFIIIRKPFEVGDRIEIGKISGDVIDQRMFQFTLMEIGNWVHADQSTGRIVHIPNYKILTDALYNYSKGFSHIWNEISVVVTFESDWEKTKKILETIANKQALKLTVEVEKSLKEAAKKFMIFYKNLTPIVYTSVEDHGVMFSIRYLCPPQKRRSSTEIIWEDILKTFKQHDDIELAYGTTRVIVDRAEQGRENNG